MCDTAMSFIEAITRILCSRSPVNLTIHLSVTWYYHPEICSYNLLRVHKLHWINVCIGV